MKSTLSQNFFNALNNGRLKTIEGNKKWYNYNLVIQKLIRTRNLFNGFKIDIYDLEDNFLETVKIEIKSVIEFGYIHNKIFLYS